MRFDIITIFPKSFDYLNESILKRAREKGLIEIKIHNLRDFSTGKYKKVDDKPYGGGPGMVLQIEPLVRAIQFIKVKAKSLIVIFSPVGKQFDNTMATNLARKYNHLLLICGHYEGIDERLKKVVKDLGYKTQEVSIGPYVLTGGELPAMVLIDVISRRLSGVLGKEESLEEKRLGIGVPVYTRPEVFVWRKKDYCVPKVLLSGNHLKIAQWRIRHRKIK